jgi:hypothetical protein
MSPAVAFVTKPPVSAHWFFIQSLKSILFTIRLIVDCDFKVSL